VILLTEALAELTAAREHVKALEDLVAARQAGAASLATAQWVLHQALLKVDRLRYPEHDPPSAAA